MPRKSRIDAPGALHHIIVRGIDCQSIFRNDEDRNLFLDRFGRLLKETRTPCLAWALLPNHFHLLLKTGQVPIATLMRRLLTGYAVYFNRRHRRHGHLFQNRYKSILCEEEVYLWELIRYIHLNPLRAGVVKSLNLLEKYPFSGHSGLVGRRERDWQDVSGVLGGYGNRVGEARRRYREFVGEGILQGRRPELVGGGLVRSHGGWAGVRALRGGKGYERGDERILGGGDFVEEALAAAEEAMERRERLKGQGYGLEKVILRVSELMGLKKEEVGRLGKERRRVAGRSLVCYWGVREVGLSMVEVSRRFGLSLSGVSQSVRRGEALVREKGYRLSDL
jgi:putative transposase